MIFKTDLIIGFTLALVVLTLGAEPWKPNLSGQNPDRNSDPSAQNQLRKKTLKFEELDVVGTMVHKNESFKPDEPFVFDILSHQEQDQVSLRTLINKWNRLVFDKSPETKLNESPIGRNVGSDCSNVQCHVLATCQQGSCVCNSGLEGDGINKCEDSDECQSAASCPGNRVCLNLYRSFHCMSICKNGFTRPKNSSTCFDINECAIGINTCKPPAVCVNTPGSYACVCPSGITMEPSGECPKPKIELEPIVQCHPDRMEVTVTSGHLENFKPAKNAMLTNPSTKHLLYLQSNQSAFALQECTLQPSGTAQNTSYVITVLYTSCGTEKVMIRNQNFTEIHQKNILWWSSIFKNMPFVLMPYIMFEIDCKFSKQTKVVTANATTGGIQEVRRKVQVPGKANVTMKFWRFPPGYSLSQPSLIMPLEYVIGEILYVTVELHQDGLMYVDNPFLRMDECYASSVGSIARVHIISNGCASPDSSFKHRILLNGEARLGVFMFQMFQLRSSKGMIVDCDATLCRTKCKPTCSQGRRKRGTNETLSDNEIRFAIGNVHVTSGAIKPVQPRKPMKPTIPKGHPSSVEPAVANDVTMSIILPIMLISANICILIILGLISYALARSVSSKRRAKLERRNRETLFDETVGQVSFSPQSVNLGTPSGHGISTQPKKFAHTHSFCQDKNCHFMRDITSKNHHLFNKSSRNRREPLFKPVVYDTSSLTFPTPFNSPPPSPPIATPAVISTGTSPIRFVDTNANQSQVEN